MKTVWTRFAVENLKNIYIYFLEIAGPAVASKIRNGIVAESKKISKQPLSGQIQESLLSLRQEHRYIIKGHYKVIYRIINEEVVITDVFDTRQHPSKMNDDNRKL
ncbi:hypothetical protein AM493_11865 [Flavobacterium akiainvivens]|uniref:Plasmid stabilization protein n=1 Tax=Flavobacterium akiainvivens TaxID=1202724 RepID=A0A0M8MI14_9FLAO|nr:type II toxin-antitoxin system RelE/ParE family toxin [Flavobacterium akiainvivens]KOS06651.1 hypothetical protein AM493_11865 [Flavobacterium akiainvivens]SFQ70428.1 Plasmid stabilization system protein ParE [Flavobacterium akiainvivens]